MPSHVSPLPRCPPYPSMAASDHCSCPEPSVLQLPSAFLSHPRALRCPLGSSCGPESPQGSGILLPAANRCLYVGAHFGEQPDRQSGLRADVLEEGEWLRAGQGDCTPRSFEESSQEAPTGWLSHETLFVLASQDTAVSGIQPPWRSRSPAGYMVVTEVPQRGESRRASQWGEAP